MFRFEANGETGMGHAMRCLALAQRFLDDGHSCQVLHRASDSTMLEPWLRERERFLDRLFIQSGETRDRVGSRADADETLLVCARFQADWLVLDSYSLGSGYRAAVRASRARRLYFDDTGSRYEGADIVLNQNCRGPRSEKFCDGETLRLNGLRYFLARRSVREARKRHTGPGAVCKNAVLVSMGGADTDNAGIGICEELQSRVDSETPVLFACTSVPEGMAVAEKLAARYSNVEVYRRPDLADLMPRAKVGICAGGVTSMEFCCAGVAPVIIPLADNQVPGASALGEVEAARVTGSPLEAAGVAVGLLADEPARKRLSATAMDLVDGRGADRVAREMDMVLEGTLA